MKCRVYRPRPGTLRARDSLSAAPKKTSTTRVCGNVGPKQTVTVCLKRTGAKPSKTLSNETEVCKYMKGIGNADRESFWVLHLNTQNQVIGVEEVAKGHVKGVEVHPREVFKGALLNNATAMLIAHNHPSGNANPSRDDAELTERLVSLGRQIGIPVLDHVIVAAGGKCTSFRAMGMLGENSSSAQLQASDVLDVIKPPTMGSKVLEWFVGGLLLTTVGGVVWWKWNQISSSGVPLNYALSRTFSRKFFEGSLDLKRSYLKSRQQAAPAPQATQTAGARALPPLFR